VGHAVIGVILSYVLAIQLVATGFVATRMVIAASEDAMRPSLSLPTQGAYGA
jgi:hypothetical protein